MMIVFRIRSSLLKRNVEKSEERRNTLTLLFSYYFQFDEITSFLGLRSLLNVHDDNDSRLIIEGKKYFFLSFHEVLLEIKKHEEAVA